MPRCSRLRSMESLLLFDEGDGVFDFGASAPLQPAVRFPAAGAAALTLDPLTTGEFQRAALWWAQGGQDDAAFEAPELGAGPLPGG